MADSEQVARARYLELKRILEERRREILADVQSRMREVRAKGDSNGEGVLDVVESFGADVEDDIEFALLQMKSETLNRIEDALKCLEAGSFGDCTACGNEIPERRLRALPFTIRCKNCEELKEVADRRAALGKSRKTLFD